MCYCFSTGRRSQLQTSTYVNFLEVRNTFISHRMWYANSMSRNGNVFCSPMIALCRLYIKIFLCTIGRGIWCPVTHFKTLGTALLFSSREDEFSETHRWNYDAVIQIFTFSTLHKPINLYTVITLHSAPSITVHWLYVCIVLCCKCSYL